MRMHFNSFFLPGFPAGLLVVLLWLAGPVLAQESETTKEAEEATFNEEEIYQAAKEFFGETTEGLAKVIERVFADQGRPNAYIAGEEVSGAIGLGVRYGNGDIHFKSGIGGQKVYWQGPSIGFDLGGNASKVFVLVYNLNLLDDLFQRFPAGEGAIYVIAGLGLNYHRSGDIVLAPIRTGVGLRLGVNVGYMHYTREHSWVPL